MIKEKFIVSNFKGNDNKYLVYSKVNKKLYKINSDILNDNIEIVQDKFGSINSDDKYENILYKAEKKLNLVRVLLTNRCNLHCKYCYADGGNYGHKEVDMSLDICKKVCNYLYDNYGYIRELNFFGGEPCLNLDCIEYISKYVWENYDFNNRPRLSLITNGTIINDRLLKLINTYNINLIVSLDYPDAIINDKTRVFADGRGSFDIVNENIIKILTKTKIKPIIEVTYNKSHIDKGITYIDIMNLLYKKYGLKISIIQREVYCNESDVLYKESLNDFKEMLELFIEDGITNHTILSFFSSIFNNKYSEYYCDAGIGQIAISPEGYIYPCQMFISKTLYNKQEEFRLSSIYDDKVDVDLLEWFEKYNFKNGNECNSCLSKNYCTACAFFRLSHNKYRHLNCSNNSLLLNEYYSKIEILLDIIVDYEKNKKFREKLSSLPKEFMEL